MADLARGALPAQQDIGVALQPEDFRAQFGEDLRRALDISTWGPRDLQQTYARIEREVRDAIRLEGTFHRRIRSRVFGVLNDPAIAPKGGGVFAARLELLPRLHAGLLFNGGVEACDGTVQVHDTLPLTVYQVGVSLVSYRGDQGTFCQRLFRRDFRQQGGDPVERVMELLQRRSERGGLNRADLRDPLGELARRALMSYGERAILTRVSQAVWRMGQGNPIPYELLTGTGCFEVMLTATTLLRELIEERKKFVFVSSEPRERMLLTIGQALRPMEYAIVDTLENRLRGWIHQERFLGEDRDWPVWDGTPIEPWKWIPRFIEEVASQVVIGVYRASRLAPAQVFYAHADHAALAAHLVLADSVLQEHRGFPLLLDLADHVCGGVFGATLRALTESAYASAGAPWRYESERTTRQR